MLWLSKNHYLNTSPQATFKISKTDINMAAFVASPICEEPSTDKMDNKNIVKHRAA